MGVSRVGYWASGIVLIAGSLSFVARADQPPPPTVKEDILVKAKRLLLKEKNSPSAVTELGQKQIDQEGVLGSTSFYSSAAPTIEAMAGILPRAPEVKVFLFFSSEKNTSFLWE